MNVTDTKLWGIVIKLTCFVLYQGQSMINFIAEHFTWIYHFNGSLISIVGEFLERRPLFVCCNNLYYLLMTQTTTNLLSSTQYLFKCNKCIWQGKSRWTITQYLTMVRLIMLYYLNAINNIISYMEKHYINLEFGQKGGKPSTLREY